MEREEDVVIVGAGIAGLATAIALRIVGIQKILVLERSNELRATGAALTLAPNAWRVLEVLNVAHVLYPIYKPTQTRRIVNLVSGTTLETSLVRDNDRDKRGMRSVHRKVLLEALAEKLPPDTIRFSSNLVSIVNESKDKSSHPITLLLDDGTNIKTKALIGCDGVNSVVAQWLGLAKPMYAGRTAYRGLAVFDEGHGYKKDFQQFIDRGKRAGMVPVSDTEIYWFMNHLASKDTAATEKEMAKDPELMLKDVTENLAKNFPSNYLQVVKHSDPSITTWAPLVFRVPWNLLFGRTHKGCITVAGDAMHPMTPDLGQGGCMALEDSVVLARNLARAHTNEEISQGIEKYVKERRWRVSWIVMAAVFTGWVQQGDGAGPNIWRQSLKWFREKVFFKFIFPRILDAIPYDCGDLPLAQ